MRDPSPSEYAPMMDDVMEDEDSPAQTPNNGRGQMRPATAMRRGNEVPRPQNNGRHFH